MRRQKVAKPKRRQYPEHILLFVKLAIPNPRDGMCVYGHSDMLNTKYAAMDVDGSWFIYIRKPEYRQGEWHPDRRGEGDGFYIGNCDLSKCAFTPENSLTELDTYRTVTPSPP